MNIAIYSRKSKFSSKGDSIENQIELCKQHVKRFYTNEINHIFVYEDEGFSGGNVDRPAFKRMMDDIKNKKINMLVCYKLDRISRNVSDFSHTYEILEKYNVTFVSISENFDTATPLGKAMLYIASVFAQLERETIAERVRDNMYELAKSGRWLGGRACMGFDSIQKTYTDENGKQRKYSMLIENLKEQENVKNLYDKYLELNSLTKVRKWVLLNDLKGKQGGKLKTPEIDDILRSVYYVKADNKVFEYLKSQGFNVFGNPDNEHGLLIYSQKSEKIISVGKHLGFIDSETWLKTQKILDKNREKAPRLDTSHTALLTGVLKCKCGNGMRVHYSKDQFYYICNLKSASNGEKCNSKNINGLRAEKIIIDKIKNLNKETVLNEIEAYKEEIKQNNIENTKKIKILEKNITTKENSIKKLISRLALVDDSLLDSVLEQMDIIKEEVINFKNELKILKEYTENINSDELNAEILMQNIKNFNVLIDNKDTPIELKRSVLKQIISRIDWDFEKDILDIHFFYKKKF